MYRYLKITEISPGSSELIVMTYLHVPVGGIDCGSPSEAHAAAQHPGWSCQQGFREPESRHAKCRLLRPHLHNRAELTFTGLHLFKGKNISMDWCNYASGLQDWFGHLDGLDEWVVEWVVEWVGSWVSGFLSEWVLEWVGAWVSGCLSEWVFEWVGAWVSGWVLEWNPVLNQITNVHDHSSSNLGTWLWWYYQHSILTEGLTEDWLTETCWRTKKVGELPLVTQLNPGVKPTRSHLQLVTLVHDHDDIIN